jgi:hypothetical protein
LGVLARAEVVFTGDWQQVCSLRRSGEVVKAAQSARFGRG